jgi:hypothetical protein
MQLARSNSESSPASDKVTLNVGGTMFQTHLATLRAHGPNYFSKLLGSKYATIFIDRNPCIFEHILDYLRGYPNVAESLDPLTRTKFEADLVFYQLK